ncbi:hypothetical protein K469DRAFT_44169 [Zopfia rhizophila CBS 207.26]|uniref:Secreted protein n=1 Tax=Zopfia rhizophila CBS 207.26 TaxID=1314779 RepID=A0A6A6ECA1_9PEZI|nr:hypothetical protein K469DRAFT_44169 [Zopfia rhizophila CBS 207.26]
MLFICIFIIRALSDLAHGTNKRRVPNADVQAFPFPLQAGCGSSSSSSLSLCFLLRFFFQTLAVLRLLTFLLIRLLARLARSTGLHVRPLSRPSLVAAVSIDSMQRLCFFSGT